MKVLLKKIYCVECMVPKHHRIGPLPSSKEAYGNVMRIALPSIAEMLLMSLIGSADTIMVGQLGKNALAAVALPTQPRMMMLSIFFALNVGVTAIVARRKGEGKPQDANKTLRNALMLVMTLSLFIMGVALTFAEPLMRFAGGNTNTHDDTEVLKGAVTYFSIMAWSLPVSAVSMCINSALRGVGNTKVTLKVNVVSNIVNVVLNYLLIPRLGVAGAAIASVIGIATGASLSLTAVLSRKQGSYLHISYKDSWRIDPKTMRTIIRVGGNAMIEQLSLRFGFFIYSRVMYSMGVALYAAHNIAMQFLSITFSLADGIAIAGTSLVGQKLGEKRYDLSMMYGHVCYRIAISVSLALASFIVALRTPISSLFINSNTPNAGFVVTAAAQTMIVVAIMQPFQMGSVVYSGSLRGAGDNLYVAKVMALCVSILRPLLAILAVRVLKLSLPMTWLLSLSEMALRAILFARRFSSGKWRESRV